MKPQAPSKLTKPQVTAFAKVIQRAGLAGWGGDCAAAAAAINTVLFAKQGKYVMATNEVLAEAGFTFCGHIAVEYGGRLFDAQGYIWDEPGFESWGTPDPVTVQEILDENPELGPLDIEAVCDSPAAALHYVASLATLYAYCSNGNKAYAGNVKKLRAAVATPVQPG